MRTILIALGIGFLFGALLALAAGYWLWHHEPQPTRETFRPGQVQADGSVSLTRIPTAPADAGPPPHQLPPGAKESARVHVRVTPKPRPAENGAPACQCKPLNLDLSLYKGRDGTGVVASTDDGDIDVAHSTYTPMQDLAPPQFRRFAHITHEPGTDNYTGTVGRRYLGNRLGLGLGLSKQESEPVRPVLGLEFNW